jgi:hypothetical protein
LLRLLRRCFRAGANRAATGNANTLRIAAAHTNSIGDTERITLRERVAGSVAIIERITRRIAVGECYAERIPDTDAHATPDQRHAASGVRSGRQHSNPDGQRLVR